MIECKLESGAQKNLRHVTVSVIVVNQKAEVLLVKRAPEAHQGGKYGIPSGFLRRDEDTAMAALRQVEKTGFFGRTLLLFQVNDSPQRPKEDRQNLDFVYVIQVTGGDIAKNEDFTTVEWYPFDKLPPEDDFAYDHRKTIELYFQYLYSPFTLPILGRTTQAHD